MIQTDVVTRTCTVCGTVKPLVDFPKDSRGKNGHRADCKDCNAKKRKAYYEQNRDAKLAKQAAYYKANADRVKSYVKSWRESNPDKCRDYHREYAERNPEKELERHRIKSRRQPRERRREIEQKWDAKNPSKVRAKTQRRRIRKKGNGEFVILDRELRRLYASPCVLCGTRERITADHIVPIALGGRHSIGNLQPLCLSCNSSKGARLMIQVKFYAELDEFVSPAAPDPVDPPA